MSLRCRYNLPGAALTALLLSAAALPLHEASGQPPSSPFAGTAQTNRADPNAVVVAERFRFFEGGRTVAADPGAPGLLRAMQPDRAGATMRQLGVDLPAGLALEPAASVPVGTMPSQPARGPGIQATNPGPSRLMTLNRLNFQGVPLAEGSDLLSVATADGRVLAVRERNVPDRIDGATPEVARERAVEVALATDAARAASATQISAAGLEVFVGADRQGRLAWRVVLGNGSLTQPFARAIWVAAIGQPTVLAEREAIFHDHQGNVTATIWGASPLAGSQSVPAGLATVDRDGGGSGVTDGTGRYAIPGGAGNATVTARLAGPNAVVDHVPGAEFATSAAGVPAPGSIDLALAAGNDEQLAQTSAFFWTNVARGLVQEFVPATALASLPVRVNIADSCNAFWDGGSINFFQAGGGCPNTANADVVLHEYGHGVDDRLGGILDGGYSEGFGDALGLIGTRQPCLGRDFFGAGTCLRPATDVIAWPPGPTEGVHEQGRRYAGFTWALIEGLQALYPADQAFEVARQLVLGAAVANPADIPDAVRLSFVVDDDDGNLATCSPHFRVLAAAADSRSIPRPADCAAPADLWAGSIWRSTGVPCSGESCPGWERLDNNPSTAQLVAGRDRAYQLHMNGRIWRSTGAPCSGDSCPGWELLDNNPRTVLIRAGGDALYQLHLDGRIWVSNGQACSGESCPGWVMLDNNPAAAAIAASETQLFQLHRDGRIWVSTGQACSGESCPGWVMLDNNPSTVGIAASGATLFQLHRDGRIWQSTGQACSGESCPGWVMLDNNPSGVDIATARGALFQRHRDGRIWQATGTPCSGESCPGWAMLDNNPAGVSITGGVVQSHRDGRIWAATGTPCSGESCPGWTMLDNNPRTGVVAASVGGNGLFQQWAPRLFQLHEGGAIWRWTGGACTEEGCPSWQLMDNNPATVAIVASAGELYQLHRDGRIWQSNGVPCGPSGCPGWVMLDNNPATKSIVAAGGRLYQLHASGAIWQATGIVCSGDRCPGWQLLDNNGATQKIVASEGQLYQLHQGGAIWRFTGRACDASGCPGWTLLDNNGATQDIAAAGGRLYQRHANGLIWQSTGHSCSAGGCPGWQLVDNNGATRAIAAGGGELYQLHADGRIWESTGQACGAGGCPGWRMLDNNPNTRALVASGGLLFQLHRGGAIWRSDGSSCSGESCPGWQQLDNNPRTIAIAVMQD